jgi:predicted peptidase
MFLSSACIAFAALIGTSAPAQGAGSASSGTANQMSPNVRPDSADAHIKDVFAITRVYADGLKVSAIAVRYDKAIRASSLSPAAFVVKTGVDSQRITGVYTSTDAAYFTKTGPSGQYVVLELSTDYVIPVTVRAPQGPPAARPPSAGPPAPRVEPTPAKIDLSYNPEVLTKVGNISWEPAAHPASLVATGKGGNGRAVSVTQIGNIKTADGKTITAGSSEKENYYVRNLTVDGFMKPDYRDPANGNLKYNIHFPRHYDPAKHYPLVMFLTDQNDSGSTHADALIKANGGVIWADREEEARHEAIVVVPLPMQPWVNDKFEATRETRNGPPPGQAAQAPPAGQPSPNPAVSTPYLATLNLVDYLTANIPNIDRSRIYLTGQGDGARTAIKMLIDRPNLFAAALLFAPDYDPAQMTKLSKANLWIVASQGDDASYQSMSSGIDALKSAGARIGKAEWNGQAGASQLASDVRAMANANGNIKFTVLKKGTVVPSGVADDAIDNHAYTWRIGYSIPSLRDWLFAQKK